MSEADPGGDFGMLAAGKRLAEGLNCQWRVAAAPVGNVRPSDFAWAETEVPEPGPGEVLLKTLYLSLAPVMRAYMQGTGAAGERPLRPGDVIHGRGVAQVAKSRHPDWPEGSVVQGQIGWQSWKLSRMTPAERMVRMKPNGLPAALGLGPLGMTGFSAFAGYMLCCDPSAADRMLLSGAAGGVGSIVAQLAARVVGASVVAIAGGPEKCGFARSLGCAQAIDYLDADFPAALRGALPDGLDLYFDNVGGEILAAALDHLRPRARILLCGSISEYARETPFALAGYTRLRATDSIMRGFYVYNHLDRWDEGMERMTGWLRDGLVQPHFDIVEGIENMPRALARLYEGRNLGKQICRVRGEPEEWR
ncbi:MAG: zinc-binding dehydrogenase [Allosphingosinicella sp.]|uniref:zinc-binding dehydrogenase n=1 Tax=Allosphingosinicella sp. TaxID=2823234 RepID=UPI0039502B51